MSTPAVAARHSRIQALLDSSVVVLLRHFAADGGICENTSLIMVASKVDYSGPMHNSLMLKSATTDLPDVLGQGFSYFGARSRRFVLWIRQHADGGLADAAARRGFELAGSASGSAGMYIDKPFRTYVFPAGIELVPVETATDVLTFENVVATSFAARKDPQPDAASRVLFEKDGTLLHADVSAFLAYGNGNVAGAAMTVLDRRSVGTICWVSTVPKFRGGGVASALTVACANTAFAKGAEMVVLQSSAMGEATYKRLGFLEVTRYFRMLSPSVLEPNAVTDDLRVCE